MEQEYIITVFSENKVGLLSQTTTVFTCRNVNIESLTTSESALAGIHKFTIVVRTDPEKIEKLARQVEKRIDVLKVFVFTSDEVVQQEIALYKVTRSRNVEQLVRRHNVRILEIDDDYIVVEKTGYKSEKRELFELLQPYFGPRFDTLSMGMSHDYPLAVECGSTMVRVGSLIFGRRGLKKPVL